MNVLQGIYNNRYINECITSDYKEFNNPSPDKENFFIVIMK